MQNNFREMSNKFNYKSSGNYNSNSNYRNNQSYFRRNNFHKVGPYNRPLSNRFRNSFKKDGQNREQQFDINEVYIAPSPLEMKIEGLINAVKAESLISAKLIFMRYSHEQENPVILLENAVNNTNLGLRIVFNEETTNYELKINNEKFAETHNFITKQMLKSKLYEMAVHDLKKKCFYIIKKKNYEQVKTGTIETTNKKDPETSMMGSKAHQMMLKMGWKGKGLGANEQGEEKTVAEKMVQNVTKEVDLEDLNTEACPQLKPSFSLRDLPVGTPIPIESVKFVKGPFGDSVLVELEDKVVFLPQRVLPLIQSLGSSSILAEVEEILKSFAYSTKFTILAFDPSFTKEERASIHNLALKYNLKSKSEGKNENRRITLSRKIGKWDLVKELLRNEELENESYKLIIPQNFQSLWETT